MQNPQPSPCCDGTAAERTVLVAGNWKMNETYAEAVKLAQQVIDRLEKRWKSKVNVVMCPPFTALRGVSNAIAFDKSFAQVGAQTVSTEEGGAFTGQYRPRCSKTSIAPGASSATPSAASCAARPTPTWRPSVPSCRAAASRPSCASGSPSTSTKGARRSTTWPPRSAPRFRAPCSNGVDLAVAYEPVWAIGSGLVPTPEHVQAVAAAIRSAVAEVRCDKRAASVRILYGGSVKPGNCAAFVACPDVDGVLVGGDSLNADSFVNIVERSMNA